MLHLRYRPYDEEDWSGQIGLYQSVWEAAQERSIKLTVAFDDDNISFPPEFSQMMEYTRVCAEEAVSYRFRMSDEVPDPAQIYAGFAPVFLPRCRCIEIRLVEDFDYAVHELGAAFACLAALIRHVFAPALEKLVCHFGTPYSEYILLSNAARGAFPNLKNIEGEFTTDAYDGRGPEGWTSRVRAHRKAMFETESAARGINIEGLRWA